MSDKKTEMVVTSFEAAWLMSKGYWCIRVDSWDDVRRRFGFCFEYSDELQKHLDDYHNNEEITSFVKKIKRVNDIKLRHLDEIGMGGNRCLHMEI